MCFEDPMDFSLWILKFFSKCLGGEMGMFFYLMRGVAGLSFDFAEAVVLAVDVLDVFAEGDTTISIVAMLVMVLLFVFAIFVLSRLYAAATADDLDDDDRQVRFNRFFLGFKIINVIFAAILTAGAIYGWEELDIENLIKEPDGAKIFLVVSLGIDILLDPFELIIGLCIHCRN